MAGGDNSIEVEGLVREFKKGPRAVDGIDLRVEPGEIYGFLGPNGAGKSTTVLMLTTLLPPTAGTARVAGFDVVKEGPSVRRTIGAALQEAALDPMLTGREHLRLQAALQGIARDERKAREQELLDRVGLSEAADRKVKGYSGGMKRRLDIALGLVHRPSVLFLDEPTTGLDPEARVAMWEEVQRLAAQESLTILLTTHYLEEADQLADRLAIVSRGRIIVEGTPEELKSGLQGELVTVDLQNGQAGDAVAVVERFEGARETAADGQQVRTRVPNGAQAIPALLSALEGAGIAVASVATSRPSLDDVYLHYTGREFSADDAEGQA
jgi:ABC-2 type transport system ATP-binding protein